MSLVARVLVLVLFLLPTTAIAESDDWQVAKATSQVKYTIDLSNWMDLHAGDVVPNRAWVSTGPRGRVELARGVESIDFQPNTTASITTNSSLFSSRKTEVRQQTGTLDLEIEKRSQPHTTVQTPYLAAVVKGTIFHVSVGKTTASVSVDRGLVQVTSFASGQQANVGPHQAASVDRNAGMTVSGQVSTPSITSVAPSVAKVPALGAATLSGQDTASDSTSKSSQAGTAGASGDSGSAGGGSSGSGNGNGKSSGEPSNDNSGNDSGNGSGNAGNGNTGNGGGNGNGNGNAGNGNNGNGNSSNNGKGNGNTGNSGSNGKGNSDSNGNGNGKVKSSKK
ncbi:FecR domain-containing protein [Rhizobium sp. BR 317]|uniref:FecR domain-containing protein n=1 Tax=Rhizobium sp. BR 317 TaxID=3040015 RepID=UPI0039BF9910